MGVIWWDSLILVMTLAADFYNSWKCWSEKSFQLSLSPNTQLWIRLRHEQGLLNLENNTEQRPWKLLKSGEDILSSPLLLTPFHLLKRFISDKISPFLRALLWNQLLSCVCATVLHTINPHIQEVNRTNLKRFCFPSIKLQKIKSHPGLKADRQVISHDSPSRESAGIGK